MIDLKGKLDIGDQNCEQLRPISRRHGPFHPWMEESTGAIEPPTREA